MQDLVSLSAAHKPAASDGVDWRHNAVCREEDPELFFPIGNTGPALLQIEEAKSVCRRCPVMEHCLQWALESGEDSGVWGGLSEDERRAMKRRAARNRARQARA
ncbi:WhiB family transcriptional regulator [Streptomyces montanus]|uniref:Transcriptional regulator WhiB n=1 Tax=Streptomyces montanus TaxID=2580423 RepID=A0A5R9G2N3_9ACTN|nr:WhiB family transcriptional regulator [Streptomyces montanus]TLS45815.1 WhiB family transcriptional regulator [Streptomyces montanus]